MLRFQRLVAFCICVEVASGWTHPMVLQPKVADSRHKGHKWQRYTSRDPKGGERHPPSLLNAEPQKRSCETTSGFSELRRGRPESSLSSLSIPSGIRQATIIRRSAPLTSDLSPTPAKNEGGIFSFFSRSFFCFSWFCFDLNCRWRQSSDYKVSITYCWLNSIW